MKTEAQIKAFNKWYNKHPGYFTEKSREWRKKNPEKYKESYQRYNNSEKSREWRKQYNRNKLFKAKSNKEVELIKPLRRAPLKIWTLEEIKNGSEAALQAKC